MKRLINWIICVIFTVGFNVTTYAYDYPSSFWSINSKYVSAIESNNYNDIITYGNQEINLIKNSADGDEKRDILVTRYNQVGLAYAALGDYDNSCICFQNLYDYAKNYNDKYYDYVKAAKARVNQYTTNITLYTDRGVSTNYGAKNEKDNGVLFGLCSNGETRNKLKNESMVIIYQEFSQDLLAYNVSQFRNAAEKGIAVEFALNCPKQKETIDNTLKYDKYLKEISDLFKKYPNTPVYLRFGAEFDIWFDLADAKSFITAFRHVADYFHSRNSNVAMVWSPNQASNWFVDIDDYYPGDSYVDWVGVSLYAQRYFQGKKDAKEENEVVFKTGINADPVVAVKDIIEKYGDRKPIMLSESGCGHHLIKNDVWEDDLTDYAVRHLQEYMSYLPMVYPQIKLMAYFDHYVKVVDEKYDFRLSKSERLQNEYIRLTKGGRFIQDKYSNNTDLCYRMVTNYTPVNSVFPISCYAHKYNKESKSVTYFIDNKYVGMSTEIPYTTYIDASGFSGTHTLKAVVEFTDGQTLWAESIINIDKPSENISVEISGDEVYFDQNPILFNDRTMVPMRKIFEELGAKVSWDDNTQTALGRRGDRTVKVTVGSTKMYVNSKEINLDTPPIVVSDRTLVPVRAVAEGLGCDVDWNDWSSTVTIEPKIFKWSEWSSSLSNDIDSDLYYIETKTQYRYREKEYTTSSRNNLSGWKKYDEKRTDWSETYGPVYSDPADGARNVWSESYKSSSNYKKVYRYYRYANSSCATWGSASPDYANYYEYEFDSPLELKAGTSNSYKLWCNCGVEGGYHTVYSVNLNGHGNYPDSKWVSDNYDTRWYYQEPIYTYYYWRLDDWSSWSDTYEYGYETDERTLYRYKEK